MLEALGWFIPLMAMATFTPAVDLHGVRVMRRVDTPLIELVADGTFEAVPERVLEAMLDYEHTPSWIKELAENTVVWRGDHALEVYQRLHLPVVADRDYTLHVTWGEEGTTRWMRFSAAASHGPAPRPKVVRMPVHEGAWRFERALDGTTRAHYEVRMDLGGHVPGWMARRRSAENIPLLFEALRQRLRR